MSWRRIGQWRRAVVALGLVLGLVSRAIAAPPAWWASRGVTINGATADDYGLLNQGQLKQLATQAFNEMQARLPAGGAGTAMAALIASWQSPPASPAPEDYATVNLGQLKNVARLFYDRLNVFGYLDAPAVAGRTYPWTAATTDDDDFAYANIGQAKNLFSFEIALDTDGDGLPDWWERSHGLNPTNPADATGHPGGSPLTYLQHFQAGTPFSQWDSDGDGATDLQESLANTSPVDPAPALTLTSPSGATLVP
jgi:hypothetical protein